MTVLSGFVGALVEGWGELRTHRTRVLLSLIGVALAIAALTGVIALGAVAQQAITEQNERGSGRPAMLYVNAYDPITGMGPDAADMSAAVAAATDIYRIGDWSRQGYGSLRADTVIGPLDVNVTAVDRDYRDMYRLKLEKGRWFGASDENRLSSTVVVNRTIYQALGSPDLATHPTIELRGDPGTIAEIIGVYPSNVDWGSYEMYMLYPQFAAQLPPDQAQYSYPNYSVWVPPELADELAARLKASIAQHLGTGFQVDVNRQDYLAFPNDYDPLLPFKVLLGGAAGLLLLLGGLSLLTISLVTVRYRIQEIGIKRSFGATAGRVFFSVMMESVVATAVAGVAGVAIAIFALRLPWIQQQVFQGVEDLPSFPVWAAVLGVGASIAVGALAGLLPALFAVRIKPIDAIRY